MIHILLLLTSLYYANYLFFSLVENRISSSFIIYSLSSPSTPQKTSYFIMPRKRIDPKGSQLQGSPRPAIIRLKLLEKESPGSLYRLSYQLICLTAKAAHLLNAVLQLFKQTLSSMFILGMNIYVVPVSYTKPSYKTILGLDNCPPLSFGLSYKSSSRWDLQLQQQKTAVQFTNCHK